MILERADSSPPPSTTHRQLSLPLPGLADRPTLGLSIPRQNRVFANRNLRMGQIDWVGFDMDYTLAIYRQDAMDALSIHLTLEELVARGYPAEVRDLAFDTRFPIRGLLVDKERGNVLKMDRHKGVGKGYHGTRLLPREELEELYHNEKLLPHTSRYHWIDTLFALCEVTAYAHLVTALEAREIPFDPVRLFQDVRSAIDQAHANGSVYREVTSNLDEYIDRDPELPRTLHKLRSAGKKLFLLTNSPLSYTNTVMTYLLDEESGPYGAWQQYFDVAICSAKKPKWFGEGTPFEERVGDELRPFSGTFERGRVYEGGGLREFERVLGLVGPKTLYVGDHIYGDILRSKKESTWRTAFIIQELDQEIAALEKSAPLRARRRQLAEARPLLEDELRYYTARYKEMNRGEGDGLSSGRAELKEHLDRLKATLAAVEAEYDRINVEHDAAFHPYFGPLLKEMNGLSIFGQQVDLYADIYLRRVSCLGYYSPIQFFRSPHDLMPHEI